MSTKSTPRPAWGPWTFQGVANFAHAPLGRLLVLEAVVALALAACGAVFVTCAWLPALNQAVRHLPEQGAITQGQLQWPGMLPQQLTESRFLGIVVVNRGGNEVGQTADVQIEFGPDRWRVRSLLGYVEFAYPEGWRVELARKQAEPWWGARRPFAIAAAFAGVLVLMPLSWALLGLLYAPVAKGVALLGNRDLSVAGGWKLGSAALMPGAALMCAAVALHTMQRIPLAAVLGAWVAHLAVGWVYLLVAPFRLPRAGADGVPPQNPFTGDQPKGGRGNPFAG